MEVGEGVGGFWGGVFGKGGYDGQGDGIGIGVSVEVYGELYAGFTGAFIRNWKFFGNGDCGSSWEVCVRIVGTRGWLTAWSLLCGGLLF